MDINKKLGVQIRYIRQMKNYTQEELADKSGLHRTYIGQIERAEKNITIKNLQRIAAALEMEISDIIRFEID